MKKSFPFKDVQYEGVTYILVGGFAMAFHGHIRATIDHDLWIRDEKENLGKFKGVLERNGVAGLDSARSLELIAGVTQFHLGFRFCGRPSEQTKKILIV